MFEHYQDPLHQFHNLLRMGRMDGYPNLIYANPHPFEMSQPGIRRNRFPFRYGQGREARQLGTVLSGVRNRNSFSRGDSFRYAPNVRVTR